jgi:hypothetical protein
MPLIYRSMTREDDDRPRIEGSSRGLGVRVPPDPNADIALDADGNVHPATGGMSVAPNWRQLPRFRIPRRLRSIVPAATGSDRDCCWRMGAGPFEDGALCNELFLRTDSNAHGTVDPAIAMPLARYQSALAATRDQWVIDES